MEDWWPVGAGAGPSVEGRKTDVSSTSTTVPRAPQRSRPSGTGVIEETGMGTLFEQLSPEQGDLPGAAGRSDGD